MNPLDTPDTPDDPSTHPADDSIGDVNPLLIPDDAPTLPGTWAVEHEGMVAQPEPREEPDPAVAFDDLSMPTPIIPPAALNMGYFMEPPRPEALPPVAGDTPAPPRRHRSVPLGVVALVVIGALVAGALAGGALLYHPAPPASGGSGGASVRSGGLHTAATATTGGHAPTTDQGSTEGGSVGADSGTHATATPAGTATATPAGTASAQPGPVSTATATPEAPQLVISPTSITMTCTILTQSQVITVQNAGGGLLTWQATPSDPHVQAHPASGQLDAGDSQGMTLSNSEVLGQSFTVSFTSNGGSATLTVTCQAGG